jgi:hypothetical protein
VAVAVAAVTLSLRAISACMKGAKKDNHPDTRVAPTEPGRGETNPHRVSIKLGCEGRFASVETGPKERSGNQTPQHCIRRTRTGRMRPTNHALGGTTGATKMISKPVERSAQTVSRSCSKINTVSKWIETSFHLTHVTKEDHRKQPK